VKATHQPIGGERDLWLLWESRRLPIEMRTRAGRGVRILFPGLANSGAGPDFLGAQIAFEGEGPRRGDVELHLRAGSWEGHGHHRDAHYNTVILHVVLEDDGGTAMTSAGLPIPVLALGPLLTGLTGPRAAGPTEGPCRSAEASRPDPTRMRAAIDAAGRARFTARAARWESELAAATIEDCMLRALLRTAGMGGNGEACLALADALDGPVLERLLRGSFAERQTTALAALLGMSGLLDQARAGEEIRRTWALQQAYWPGRPLDGRRWRRFRLRPSNLPEARLAIVAAILARDGLAGFLHRLTDLIDSAEPRPTPDLLEPLLPQGSGAGRSWALEGWANAFLPLLAALGSVVGRAELADRASRAYAVLPGGGDNRLLVRMCGFAGLAGTPRTAIGQQGLLHIWAEYCSRQDCPACPLAEASRAPSPVKGSGL
jgi:uncharacterized protein DUF2851